MIRPPKQLAKAVALEHRLASIIGLQERDGVWLDEALANDTVKEINEKADEIEKELEPMLPMQIEMMDTKVKGEQFTHGVKRWSTTKGLSKTTKEWFDPNKDVVVKERGQKRKDGTKAKRTYVFPPFPYDAEDIVEGPYCRVGWFKLELTSAGQVSDFLLKEGWVPTEYNVKKVTKNESKDPASPYYGQVVGKTARNDKGEEIFTSPKLTEDSFDTIKGDTGKLIVTHRSLLARKKFISGMLRSVRDDGRISQGAVTVGAVTTRVQHRTIVNTPRASSFYGKPCRAIFYAEYPYFNFGADLSGLEDRMKAHYTYNYPGGKEYAQKILDPDFSVHEENMALWNVDKETAKPGAYALSYNCGPPKLAKTLGVSLEVGQKYFDAYWEKNMPLKLFNDEVVELFKARKAVHGKGYVVGIDGRLLFPRSPHSASNTLFQSAGNIVAKTAVCLMHGWKLKHNLDGWQWSFNHDEYQWCVHEQHIEGFYEFDDEEEAIEFWKANNTPMKSYRFSKPSPVDGKFWVIESPVCDAMIKAFLLAGRRHKIRVPTTGECMVGRNWSHCH